MSAGHPPLIFLRRHYYAKINYCTINRCGFRARINPQDKTEVIEMLITISIFFVLIVCVIGFWFSSLPADDKKVGKGYEELLKAIHDHYRMEGR